ncbi:hypothetical protein FB45DRAFT_472309 [Roridomyces roridus]|uniref:F-box domain-containing protein n=1 Tax=Roridomyces roridus TaxID=1738132 RepID=A0AAD7FRU3_9AGAR|nr:hypothetical protein FB45DRAFT_472309 [Roridomyces roridus]
MLTSLPNEILLVVFSHLEDPYPLYPLSTLCRRLHFLALPIYLSRTGVLRSDSPPPTDSYNVIIGAEETHVLAALQTSLFLSKLKNISCSFSNLQSQLKDLRRFQRFCSMLESIETVNLQFSRPSFDEYDDRIHEMYFYDTLIQIFNVVLEKSCTSLTVDAVLSDTMRVSKRHRATGRSSTVGLLSTSRPLSSAAIRKRKLSVFKIHCDILLSPHCRGWTLDVLNTFPLSTVSIHVQSVPTDVWDLLLSQTEIPTLSDLSMDCRVKPVHMHAFLARHPSVTGLHLSNIPTPSLQERLPPGHLPRLKTLSATAAQVAYLLHALENTDALQNIRVLSHMTRLDLIFADASLRSVATRLEAVSLCLVLPLPSNLPRMPVDLNLIFSDEAALHHVSTLEFVFEETNNAFFRLSDYVSVTAWFAPFPGVRTVVLVGFNASYNIALMLEAVRTRAPTIETLVVDGVVHNI